MARFLCEALCWALLLGALGMGCATLDRVTATKFEPLRFDAGAPVFKFTAFADAVYPLESVEAEHTRIHWLETWLQENGYDSTKYTVLSRHVLLRHQGLLGNLYDIFYEARVEP